MSKILSLDDKARLRRLRKQQRGLDFSLSSREDLLGLVNQMSYRLVEFAPPGRYAELAHVLRYIQSGVDLSGAYTLYSSRRSRSFFALSRRYFSP
jgi:hypothetical protein